MRAAMWLGALLLTTCAGADAMAEETSEGYKRTVLAIDLVWKNFPRNPDDIAAKTADIPGGLQLYRKTANGFVSFDIMLGEGRGCGLMQRSEDMIALQCYVPGGYFALFRGAGQPNAQLDWVQTSPPVAEGAPS